MDERGVEGYGPGAGQWDQAEKWFGTGKKGQKACFCAVMFYGSSMVQGL